MNRTILILLLFISVHSFGQPSVELSSAILKYPDQLAIIQEKSLDVEFKLNKSGDPFWTYKQKDVVFVLTDNYTSYANEKEYYGYGFNLNKISAYTLVPASNGYKKMVVNGFKKTSEIGDGLFYDDQVAMNFTYPSVCKGSKLVKDVDFLVDKPSSPVIFYFGSYLPIEKARLELVLPDEIKIKFKLFGVDTSRIKFSKEKKGDKWLYRWTANDIPRYISDDDAPSFRYFWPHVVVLITEYEKGNTTKHLFRNLDDLYAWDYDKIKDLNPTIDVDVKRMADSITNGASDDLEKVKKIYRWVQKNIRYVGIEDGDNGFIPRPASLVLHRRYGDCKDKSSLIKALINSQGIAASLVWVGTRELPYKYSDFPSIMADNHMIVSYTGKDGKEYLLDGTTTNYPLDITPWFIQGKECLIEKGKDSYKLYKIPVSSPETNSIIDSAFFSLASDTIVGESHLFLTGEPKVNLINRLDETIPDHFKKVIISSFPKGNNKIVVSNVELSDLSRIYDTLKLKYKFKLPNYITSNGNVYLNLNLEKTYQEVNLKPDREQPYEQDYPVFQKSVYVFKIPENYDVQKIPIESSYANDKYSFKIKYERVVDKIVVTREIKMNFLLLQKEDFPSFKEMISTLNKSYIQTLVLRKKQQ